MRPLSERRSAVGAQDACERSFTPVRGARIETLAWGPRNAPGVILFNGFGASADWWCFTAPLLAGDRRVVAFSYSGTGRSGWREHYDIDLLKDEALACGMAAGAFDAGPAAVVAHSFGATPGARLAAEQGERIAAFVVLDRPVEQWSRARIEVNGPRPRRRFASEREAMEQFSPRPFPRRAAPDVIAHVARAGVENIGSDADPYWTWRHDPDLRLKLVERQVSIAPQLAAMACPAAFIRGGDSALFPEDEAVRMREAGMRVLSIPEAGHHLMLDRPPATAVAIEACLSPVR